MKKLFFLLVVITFTACQENEASLEETYKENLEEVLKEHDESMPKMGDIGSYISKLEAKEKSGEGSEKHAEVKNELKESHDAMMKWMKNFGERFPDVMAEKEYSEDEYKDQIEMLKEEKKEIKEIGEKMESSIEAAKQLLAK